MDSIYLCVLQADERDMKPLIFRNFLNIQKGRCEQTAYHHIHEDEWFVQSKSMITHQMVLYKGSYENKQNELINFILTMISKGYYLIGEINGKYLSAKWEYDCYDTKSSYLIYGYDQKCKLLYAVGKTKDQTLAQYQITFKEYLDGIFNLQFPTFTLTFINSKDEAIDIKTNLGEIHNGIYDYIHSKNRYDTVIPKGEAVYCIFGIDCYKDFYRKIQYVHEYEQYIEPLHYQIFWEHHKVIRELMKYLLEQCDMVISLLLKEYSEEICVRSEQIYDMCVSYNRQNDPVLLKNILDNIGYIIKHEPMILQQLLDVLKEKVKQLKTDKDKS